MSETINREASPAGPRFQKLRACIRLLKAMNSSKHDKQSCAIEVLEDSALIVEGEDKTLSIEENKNYSSALSFNSEAIKNTTVAFLDLHFTYLKDPEIQKCLFASAGISCENFSEEIFISAGIAVKVTTSILKSLSEKNPLSDDEVKICKAVIVKEYDKQYSKRKGGFLESIKALTDKELKEILESIEWVLTEDGNDQLEEEAFELIRQCKYFNSGHIGREEIILAMILDKFEKNTLAASVTSKLISNADVENVFLKSITISEVPKPFDPASNDWASIKIDDFRNLAEKICAVTSIYPSKSLQSLNRKASLSKHEAQIWSKEYVALRRRIFDWCADYLQNQHAVRVTPITPLEIDRLIKEMVFLAEANLTTLKRNYHYNIDSTEIIQGAILSLFDECYLAFD